MTQQTEALRLADLLETNIWDGVCTSYERNKAADELRRLHTEKTLLENIKVLHEARIAQLLEALEFIAVTDPVDAALDPQRAVRVARAAIAAAKGEA